MSGRDAYFAYMRDFNEREGINSFYGRDKKRFLAGWHGVKDKDRPDKIRKDVPEPPLLAPRPEIPVFAAERGREYAERKGMGEEDINRAAKKPKTAEVSAGRRVYENEDLMRNIRSYQTPNKEILVKIQDYIRNIDKWRVVLREVYKLQNDRWFDNTYNGMKLISDSYNIYATLKDKMIDKISKYLNEKDKRKFVKAKASYKWDDYGDDNEYLMERVGVRFKDNGEPKRLSDSLAKQFNESIDKTKLMQEFDKLIEQIY